VNARIIVLAKAPVPGRVKTRLCPPYTPEEAALLAAAALADTIGTVDAVAEAERILAVAGEYPAPPGWRAAPQRGSCLGERIAAAFIGPAADPAASTGPVLAPRAPAGPALPPRVPAGPALLIGMDTPQVTAADLSLAIRLLGSSDAVLGPAADGGWWALGLRDPRHAAALRDIPTSTSSTGARTLAALRSRGLRVALLPMLRDVDTAADAAEVAVVCGNGSRFAAAVAALAVAMPS
jgi:uncharacterized protein